MKTKLYFTVIAVFGLLCLSSCKKDGPGRPNGSNYAVSSSSVLNVNITHGDLFNLNLSQYGNGAASITKQAALYDVSEISYNNNTGSYIYTYSNSGSKTGGALTDKVVLKVMNEHTGSGRCGNEGGARMEAKNITINFTVK